MMQLTQRRLAYALLCLQMPLFIVYFEAYVFPLIAVAAGALGFWPRFRRDMSDRGFIGACIALIFVMYIVANSVPLRLEQFTPYLGEYGVAVAEYFVALQVVMLLRKRESGLPRLYPLATGLGLMFLGNKQVDRGMEYALYQVTALVFVLLFTLYLRSGQSRKEAGKTSRKGVVSLTVLMVIVFVASSISSRVLYRYQNELDGAIMKYMYQPDAFAGTRIEQRVALGSVVETKLEARTAVAIRIFSDQSPGYMRGYGYDLYRPPHVAQYDEGLDAGSNFAR